jgi:hypothetical protein
MKQGCELEKWPWSRKDACYLLQARAAVLNNGLLDKFACWSLGKIRVAGALVMLALLPAAPTIFDATQRRYMIVFFVFI